MPTEPWKPESVPPKLQCAGSSSDVVDCPPGGRTKEGQPRRCCHWGAGLLLRWDHFHLLFTPPLQILLLLGGYCTGDNYRDERPIDVFVLNTSNYRWTEVLVPSSSHELLSNVHVAYWSTLVQTGQDMIYCPGRKTWGRGRASRMALSKVNIIIRVFHKLHFAIKKRCNTSTHPSRVYINQIWKNFFPKTSLEGLATWSKKAKIDQNRRGGRMTVAWSFSNE